MRRADETLADNLTEIAQSSFDAALKSYQAEFHEHLEKSSAKADTMLDSSPTYRRVPLGGAKAVVGAVAFFDMRGSTKFAVAEGPKKTFLALHTLLPVIARVVTQCHGTICGFRGDGLFGLFEGMRDEADGRDADAVGDAIQASLSAIQSTASIVNPILHSAGIRQVNIGAGVDYGHMVATRIGLPNAFELTVYGNPVNQASKLCSGVADKAVVSKSAYTAIPSTPGGKLSFRVHHVDGLKEAAYIASSSTNLLDRSLI